MNLMHIGFNWKDYIKNNIKGFGLEIGAYFSPFPFNAETTKIIYQDKLSNEILKTNPYKDPHFNEQLLAKVTVISPADVLPYEDEVFDFICNSHLLEHLANPIQAIENWLSKIKENGLLYIIVPDKNYTFDSCRQETTQEHLLTDYLINHGDIVSAEHYLDFYGNINPFLPVKDVYECYLKQNDIHVHVFTQKSILEMLNEQADRLGFEILDHSATGMHVAILMRKL